MTKSTSESLEQQEMIASGDDERLARRWAHAIVLVKDSVDVHPRRRGGVPCLKGTGITLAQIVAQLAEGDSIDDLVEDMEIDRAVLKKFLEALSIIFDQSASP